MTNMASSRRNSRAIGNWVLFRSVIEQSEIDSLQVEMADLLDRAPVDNGSTVDKKGRPACRVRSTYLLSC